MRDIAALLFGAGREAGRGRRPEPFEPDDWLDRTAEAREWCGSTPGRGALTRLEDLLRPGGRRPGARRVRW